MKAVVAHYDASSLISNRDAVASQMDTKLREVLAQYNIDLQYISVTNFDFTDTFTDAVEAKVKAQQKMAKFSIMLFGIDSYTKNKMQLPYKLDAKSSDAALREARMCAMTFYPRFSETEKTDVEVVKR